MQNKDKTYDTVCPNSDSNSFRPALQEPRTEDIILLWKSLITKTKNAVSLEQEIFAGKMVKD